MGEGDPGREHQAGLTRQSPIQYSVTPVPRIPLDVPPTLFARADEVTEPGAGSSRCWAARQPTGARDQRVDVVAAQLAALAQRRGHPLTRCGQKPAQNPAAQQTHKNFWTLSTERLDRAQ